MNPLLYAKIGIGVALLAMFFYLGGLGPKAALDRDHAAMAEATANALIAQRKAAQAQAINDNVAEKAHDQELEAIPLHIRHDPVFVRLPGPSNCGVPAAKPEAVSHDSDPSSGGVQPGSGERDIRPALEQMKIKYETALADYRRLDAECQK
jgi:hypothetical protein